MARPSRAEIFVRRMEQRYGEARIAELRPALLIAAEDLMLEHDREKNAIVKRVTYWRERAPQQRKSELDEAG